MQLLSAWKDSLSLLKPANVKLFFLVTLKSIIDTAQVWFWYWWWLIVLVICGSYINSLVWHYVLVGDTWNDYVFALKYALLKTFLYGFDIFVAGVFRGFMPWSTSVFWAVLRPHWISLMQLVIAIFIALFLISLLSSARPSVRLKNWAYFKGYFKHFVHTYIFFLIMVPVVWTLIFGFYSAINKFMLSFFNYSLFSCAALGIFYTMVASSLIISFSVATLLFLLDSDGRLFSLFGSMRRSAKMVFYNVPFFVVVVGLLYTLYIISQMMLARFAYGYNFFGSLRFIDVYLIDTIFLLIIVGFITNYYTKKLHDQFSLYYKVK